MNEYTTTQYNALVEAISLGALTVKYSDKEVTYRSLPDMLRLKRIMEHSLGITSDTCNVGIVEFSRGYDR